MQQTLKLTYILTILHTYHIKNSIMCDKTKSEIRSIIGLDYIDRAHEPPPTVEQKCHVPLNSHTYLPRSLEC